MRVFFAVIVGMAMAGDNPAIGIQARECKKIRYPKPMTGICIKKCILTPVDKVCKGEPLEVCVKRLYPECKL